MARIRSIKPEFWADEDLATDLPRDLRLLYVGLWNLCFDNWTMEYKPRSIKRELFGFDDDVTPEVLDSWVHEIAASGRIVFFEHEGRACIWLPKCHEHQRVDKPQPSPIPEPQECSENVLGMVQEHSGSRACARIPSSPILSLSSSSPKTLREPVENPTGDMAVVAAEYERLTSNTVAPSVFAKLCAAHPTDRLIEAIRVAAEKGKPTPAYIGGIARSLAAEGWKPEPVLTAVPNAFYGLCGEDAK